MAHWQSVLRPGDWVHFDGGEHQVVALTGTSVRLCSSDGAQMVVLATHLMSAPDFGVIDAAPPPQMTPFGLLDTLPAPVLAAAREWERHIVEITTGVAPEGIARPEYDPAARTQIERDRAKAAELAAAGRPLGVRTPGRSAGAAQYFRLTVGQTIKTWSLMETVLSVTGLGMVLLAGPGDLTDC
jgi:putative transposase